MKSFLKAICSLSLFAFAVGCGKVSGTTTSNIPLFSPKIADTTPRITISDVSVNEGAGTATITAKLSLATNATATVDYATSNGTATAGSDYTATSGTLTWVAGDTADKTFTVSITDDGLVESAETFSVTLSNVTGGEAALGSPYIGVVTIVDNDGPPTMAITKKTGQALVTNSLPAEFTVTFSKDINAATFTAADITNTGTAVGVTWNIVSVSASVYTIQATVSGLGTLIPQIAASSLADLAGNLNTAGATSSDTITYTNLGSFTISGVVSSATGGGTDVTADANLSNGVLAKINWAASANAASYKVTVYEDDGTTVKCAEQSTASTTYDFSACTLSYGTYYKAKVNSVDSNSVELDATNSLYRFFVNYSPTTVTNVTSSTANGTYMATNTISVDVTFSRTVTVTGTPQITLTVGGGSGTRAINYTSGSGTATLSFVYTVQAGDTSSDLDYAATSSLALNGGTMVDTYTNSVDLTLVAPGVPFSLGANKALVIDTTAPSAPSALALQTPATSPNTNTTPTIRVSGVVVGDTVKLYKDSGCTQQVGSATVSSGTTVDVTTSTLTDNTYGFYATSSDPVGNASSCSVATVAYVLDTTAPNVPTTLAMQTPATTTGTTDTPIIRVSGGVVSGDIITLYSDSSCSTAVSSATTSSGVSVDITTTSLGSYGTYTIYARSKDALNNIGACTTAHVDYTYTSVPSVTFSTATQSFNDNAGAISISAWDTGMSSWTKRIKLTILNGSNAQALSNFPVLVVLDATRVVYSDFKSNGDDIRFLDSSGTNLSYEIETWNTSGRSYIWVKVPSISASSNTGYIHMYYKNAAAAAGASATNVWDTNHKAVYHLSGNLSDSTSNGYTLTNAGSTSATSSKVGSGRSFNNTMAYINSSPTITAPFTVSAWVKVSDTGTRSFFGSRSGSDASYDLKFYAGNQITGDIGNGTGWITTGTAGAIAYSLNSWYHVSMTVTSTAYTLYVNGSQLSTASYGASTPMLSDATHKLTIGSSRYDGGEVFYGEMDEVNISDVARSAGWIKAQYATSDDNYLTYGSVENYNGGAVTITVNASATYASNITIPFTVSGTAVNPTDHNLADGNITITAGQTSGTTSFLYFRNAALAANKTIIVTMGTPTNATQGATTAQTITLVAPGNTAPVASNDSASLSANAVTTLTPLANDTDADGDTVSISAVGAASHGSVSINGATLTYTPTSEYVGSDSFTYTIADPYGATSTATFNITVTALPFTWTGAAGNNTWSTAGNWSTSAVPGASDTARFNGQSCSGANCNVTITSSISIGGLVTGSAYAGTITQSAGQTITVGSSGWSQSAGNFMGGNSTITITNSVMSVSGGTFTSTSGTLIAGNDCQNFTLANGTFSANSGTVNIRCYNNWGNVNVSTGTNALNHLTLTSAACVSFTVTGTTTVAGDLTINGASSCARIYTGTIRVGGNVSSDTSCQGSGTITLTGNASGQTITTGVIYLPNLTIDAGANNVSFGSDVYIYGSYLVESVGTLSVGARNLTLTGDNWGNNSVKFGSASYNGVTFFASGVTWHNVTAGSLSAASVNIQGGQQVVMTAPGAGRNFTVSGALTVAGSLTLNSATLSYGSLSNTGTITP